MTDQLDRLTAALAERYAIEREIGRGGMATVYLATDRKHARKVAIKVFRPELAAQLGTERFLQEIRLTANLQHPHIVALYDSGEADGFLYYVMPFVEGDSLRDLLTREGRLEPADALRIARQVATALEHAHARDVVHRDIKPENIMLSGGTVLVTDFGIARATQAAGGEKLTAVGLAVGTPSYMSPEQASGVSDVDGRSDLYSLGCVLYEMLAGDPPFASDTPQRILAQQVVEPPRALATTGVDVGRTVAAVVDRLLAKDADHRFASATELREALDAASTGPVEAAGPAEWFAALWRRRVPQIVGLYALFGLLGVAFTKWLVGRLVLSPHLTTFVGVALILFLPAVAMLAFNRNGGRSGWTAVEKIGLPVNLVAAVAILFLAFGGKNLGAATTEVTVQDEEGNLVTERVPKSEFREHVAIFYLDNPGADTSLTWLRYGIPWSVMYDLSQDRFLDLRHPMLFQDRLRAAGFGDGLDVPVTLMREIAGDLHLDWFFTGSVARDGDSLAFTTRLFDTGRGRVVAERTFRGRDVLAMVDRISEQLKRDLGIPDAQIQEVEDLSARDLLTDSDRALRYLVDGLQAFFVQDYEHAATLLDSAVAFDSSFAIAHAQRFGVYLVQNRMEPAAHAGQAALRLGYKLPERIRFVMKGQYYRVVEQDNDKAMAVARMHAELYPTDLAARQLLAILHTVNGDLDSAIAQHEAILAVDSAQHQSLLEVGQLTRRLGRYDDAVDYFQRYAERFPDAADAQRELGATYRQIGQLPRALERYERAALLDEDDVGSPTGAAWILADLGRFDEADARFGAALNTARTPMDSFRVYDAVADYRKRRGRMDDAVALLLAGWRQLEAAVPPLVALQIKLPGVGTFVDAGRTSEALDTLRSIERQLPPQLTILASIGYTALYLEQEDPDSLEASLPRLQQLIDTFGLGLLNTLRVTAEAAVLQFRGECDRAVAKFTEAMELDPTSTGPQVSRAECYHQQGQLDAAARDLEDVLRIRPFHPRALYTMALVQRDRGRVARATELVEQALEVWADADPQYDAAREARALLAELQTIPRPPAN